MPSAQIVTMRHVARAARVAVSTVSKALRNDPALPEKRCRSIQAIAARLGYRPHPLVATLMAQLHNRRRRVDPHSLAWLLQQGDHRDLGHLDYRPAQLGRVAVEVVVAQIHRNERGSPAIPQRASKKRAFLPIWRALRCQRRSGQSGGDGAPPSNYQPF
jgi:hypothetical protein